MSNIFDSMLSGEGDRENSKIMKEIGSGMENSPSEISPSDSIATDIKEITSRDVKEVTQELLRHGYIEESRKSKLFQKSMVNRAAVLTALEPLDMTFELDDHRGIAFLKIVRQEGGEPGEEWSHPLVRRQRLTLEQSLLVAILRQAFVANEQEAGVGESVATVAVEDLLPQFMTYFEDSGSDAKNESRLLSLLDQLKTHGFISEVDKKHEITIRPLIAHVADPASLGALLQSLQEHAEMDEFDQAFDASAAADG